MQPKPLFLTKYHFEHIEFGWLPFFACRFVFLLLLLFTWKSYFYFSVYVYFMRTKHILLVCGIAHCFPMAIECTSAASASILLLFIQNPIILYMRKISVICCWRKKVTKIFRYYDNCATYLCARNIQYFGSPHAKLTKCLFFFSNRKRDQFRGLLKWYFLICFQIDFTILFVSWNNHLSG